MTGPSPAATAHRLPAHSETDAARDQLFATIRRDFGAQIARFAASYERDTAKRHELIQDMLLATWQSLAVFKQQCGLRTWVYRVTHNVGVNHIQRERRRLVTVDLDDVLGDAEASARTSTSDTESLDRQIDLERLLRLINQLAMPDRQIMVLYLEEVDAATIAEVVGLSPGNVATKIHRIKALLARRFNAGRTTP